MPAMDDDRLKPEEREVIDRNRWFSSLSPALRHDILRRAFTDCHKTVLCPLTAISDKMIVCELSRLSFADRWLRLRD